MKGETPMSEGIFGKDADLAQRLKDRIAFHANEHRHTYEIGKGVMDPWSWTFWPTSVTPAV